MKIGEDVWAIVKPDGTIAGDMECHCISSCEHDARHQLSGPMGKFLREVNGDGLKVQRARLVPAEIVELLTTIKAHAGLALKGNDNSRVATLADIISEIEGHGY